MRRLPNWNLKAGSVEPEGRARLQQQGQQRQQEQHGRPGNQRDHRAMSVPVSAFMVADLPPRAAPYAMTEAAESAAAALAREFSPLLQLCSQSRPLGRY